ncbi:MAG: PD40 domain-containing protein [Anaerolineales bacterium]|nr:PD40 domain-containing protein [Anaerolineales bacterium]
MSSNSLKKIWRSALVFLLISMFVFPAAVGPVHAAPGDVLRVSVASDGAQGNGFSYSGQISANGNIVVFDSDSSNLVPDDTNGHTDVFLRNLAGGTTVRVSLNATGEQGDSGSGGPSVSADGRFVAFESDAGNLVEGDTNGYMDIFVKDMQTGGVKRVSVASGGAEANENSSYPSISGDGRYVVFTSEASNLVPDDTNGAVDVFIHDLQTGVTSGVSTLGNIGSHDASISLDGRYVVFTSSATNLVADDTNGRTDVFVYAVQTGGITRASLNASGVQADKGATEPSISGDGRYVTFSSASENLMTTPTEGFTYVYVRDQVTGAVAVVSFKDGYPMYGTSDSSVISADGRYIIFSYDDRGDGMPDRWLYIHDRAAQTTQMAVSAKPADYTGDPILPSISRDGRFVAFASSASVFVPGDTNGVRDIFVKELALSVDVNPSVVSTKHGCPNGCGSPADPLVDFLVKFSEPVTGVDVGDFTLTVGGGITGALVAGVSGEGGDYIVRVDTGTGNGTLRLDVIDDDSIKDMANNPLGGAGVGNGNFTTGEPYAVVKNVPAVTSVLRADPDPTAAASVRFVVTFSEPVSGVDVGDFTLGVSGIAGASVMDVTGAETVYTVTVNTGAGDGILRLDVIDNDSIVNSVNLPLGGAGAGDGDFTSGETYTLDRGAPMVVSILRADPHPTSAALVHFTVTFSKPVSGVDGGDFTLTTSGVSGALITGIVASGTTYSVAVNTGAGNGSIRLDVTDNDSIVDALGNPLGGAGAGNGNFTAGEAYLVNKVTYIPFSNKIRSNGNNDGWVLESSEFSGVGGTKNSTEQTFKLGDDAQDRQFRAILHFPTHHLPDNAVITQVILMIKAYGVAGANPFGTHGNISLDIRYGPFGSLGPIAISALQVMDFHAPASRDAVGVIQNNPVGGWYWAMLDRSAFPYINLTGVTQIRLAFQLDDNDDLGADFLVFFSGDYDEQRDRPHLLIEYVVPK